MIAAGEVPKLKRVIQSSVLRHQDRQVLFILFDNLQYIIAKIIDASENIIQQTADLIVTSQPVYQANAGYRPVIEMSFLAQLEVDRYESLIELVCSWTNVFVIVQN